MQPLAGQTAARIELHADFVAGFYFGRDGTRSKQIVETFARSLFSQGDYAFNVPTHHGTPQQRVAAMQKGYELGLSTIKAVNALREGIEYASLLCNCLGTFDSIGPTTPWPRGKPNC
jgi:hypothetical protein